MNRGLSVESLQGTPQLPASISTGFFPNRPYPVRKNLLLDAGFDHGLTSSSKHGESFRASRTFCLTDCGDSRVQNKYCVHQLSVRHL
jgi:hypothetical protein